MSHDETSLPEGAPNDPLTGHSYDGIQEYDNPLPGWWKWLFVATILMAPPYFLYYHSGVEGRTLEDRYDQELAANLRLAFAEIGELPMTRESVVKYLYQESWVTFGKSVYKTNCISCHGPDGGGLVGPNLCDEEYKNIKDIGDFLTVIQNGANGGAMPAWKNRLSPNEIVLVSSYVASLRGSVPAKPKAPEGRPIPDWPEPPPEEQPDTSVEAADESAGGEQDATESDTADVAS
jgi:cytochrome c oxidase cbb3-type subunit 3